MAQMNPYAKLKNARVAGVNRGKMIVLVYDAAIQYIEEVKSCISKKDFSGKGIYLDKAFSAINELRVSLSYEHDEKLAGSLNQLYFYMTKQLSKATLENDSAPLNIVVELLRGLKESWQQAASDDSAVKKVSSIA